MERKCYIISFELSPQRHVGPFIEAIKSYGTWARINSNTWAVVSNDSARIIRDNLSQYLSHNDRLFVIKSAIEAAWFNTICSNEWLKNNL